MQTRLNEFEYHMQILLGAIHKVCTPQSGHKNMLLPYPHPTLVQAYSCNAFSKYNECKKSRNMKQTNP